MLRSDIFYRNVISSPHTLILGTVNVEKYGNRIWFAATANSLLWFMWFYQLQLTALIMKWLKWKTCCSLASVLSASIQYLYSTKYCLWVDKKYCNTSAQPREDCGCFKSESEPSLLPCRFSHLYVEKTTRCKECWLYESGSKGCKWGLKCWKIVKSN